MHLCVRSVNEVNCTKDMALQKKRAVNKQGGRVTSVRKFRHSHSLIVNVNH